MNRPNDLNNSQGVPRDKHLSDDTFIVEDEDDEELRDNHAEINLDEDEDEDVIGDEDPQEDDDEAEAYRWYFNVEPGSMFSNLYQLCRASP